MGTDIHPAIEVRRKGVWRYHKPKTLCRYHWEREYVPGRGFVLTLDDNGQPIPSRWGDRCKYGLPDYFHDRNYDTFYLLGGVRDGRGDGVWPIQEYRGAPPDITPQAFGRLSEEHSAGWVTLSELMYHPHPELWLKDNLPDMIAYMLKLVPKGGTTDDVRLVFDFDS
jgi:hypothetical protein